MCFPIEDKELKERIFSELLQLCLLDRAKARFLQADGNYKRLHPKKGEQTLNMQNTLMQIALGEGPELPDLSASNNGRLKQPTNAIGKT